MEEVLTFQPQDIQEARRSHKETGVLGQKKPARPKPCLGIV